MSRRQLSIRSFWFPTLPESFLKRPEGSKLVALLAQWWIAGESIATAGMGVDHSRRARTARYGEQALHRMLADADYPPLSDRDERALDSICSAYLQWTLSRKAAKLLTKLATDPEIAEQIRRGITSRTEGVDLDLSGYVESAVHSSVSHAIYSDVHHAISHAAHTAGHDGGGGHGGGGGHH